MPFAIEVAWHAGAFRDTEEREYRRRYYKGVVAMAESMARARAAESEPG